MKYVNSLKYMHSFETCVAPSDISSVRVSELCELLGRININTKSIFVPSGSAGHTTAVMLESVIKSEGYRVGRITSEFGFDCRKMVYIDAAQASIEDFNHAVAELKAKIASVLDKQFYAEEVAFALSLLLCRMCDCKYIIFEGMSCEEYDLASLCAPYDIVIVPEIREEDEKTLSVISKAVLHSPRAIVSANQKINVYNKLSNIARTGINLIAKKDFEVKHVSSIRLDFSYGSRDGYSIKTPSLVARECAMLVIDTAQAIRRDGVKVQWSNIEAGLASTTGALAFDTFSVSPLMLFDSASDEHEVSSLKATMEEVLGAASLEGLSLCVPTSAVESVAQFDDIDTLIIVGEADSDISCANAQSIVFCEDIKSAAKQLKNNIKNAKNTVAFGSVAYASGLRDCLMGLTI